MKVYLDDLEEIEINKIYLGDSYELIKKIPDKSIDLIYVDVPYFYKQQDGGGIFGNRERPSRDELKDIKDGIDNMILDEFIRVMKKVNIFIWCSRLQMLDIMNHFKDYSVEIIVWGKSNPIPSGNNTWLSDLEYCLYFRESGVKLNDGYHLKSKYYISPTNKVDKDLYNHPTIKPLQFVKQHIEHTTQEGDLVLDTFLGSGTTAVACKELGRNYIGFEINEEYYKIAQDRLNGISQVERREKEEGILDIYDFLGGETE